MVKKRANTDLSSGLEIIALHWCMSSISKKTSLVFSVPAAALEASLQDLN